MTTIEQIQNDPDFQRAAKEAKLNLFSLVSVIEAGKKEIQGRMHAVGFFTVRDEVSPYALLTGNEGTAKLTRGVTQGWVSTWLTEQDRAVLADSQLTTKGA